MSKSTKAWGVPAYKKYSLKNVTRGGPGNAKLDINKQNCGNNGQNQPSCPF